MPSPRYIKFLLCNFYGPFSPFFRVPIISHSPDTSLIFLAYKLVKSDSSKASNRFSKKDNTAYIFRRPLIRRRVNNISPSYFFRTCLIGGLSP